MRPLCLVTCPVEPVGAQVIAGHQVPDPVRALVGRPAGPPARRVLIALSRRDRRPLPARVRHQVQRPELVHAHDHGRVARSRLRLAIGDGVELQHRFFLAS